MKLTKSQKKLLVVLIIVIFYAVFDFISNNEQYSMFYLSEEKSNTTLLKPTTKKISLNKVSQNKIHYSWKRDPFIRFGKKDPVKKQKKARPNIKLVLKAITHDASNSFVMINDLILMEGEIISGYKVEQIFKDKVKLTKKDETIYLNSK